MAINFIVYKRKTKFGVFCLQLGNFATGLFVLVLSCKVAKLQAKYTFTKIRSPMLKSCKVASKNIPLPKQDVLHAFFFISTSKSHFSLSGAYGFANFSLKMVLRWCLVWPDMYCQVFLFLGVLKWCKQPYAVYSISCSVTLSG